jgi:peroxiredoxin
MGYTRRTLRTQLTRRGAAMLMLLAAATIALTWKAKSLEKRLLGHGDETVLTNKRAPDIRSQSLAGNPIALGDFKGKKKIVVSFWASWCGPCRMELPELKEFYEKYHAADSRFEVVAISTDDDRFQAEKYVKEAKLPFPIVWDENGNISNAYGVESIPVLYIIDENGKVVYGQTGYEFGLEYKLRSYLGLKDTDAKQDAPKGTDDDGGD